MAKSINKKHFVIGTSDQNKPLLELQLFIPSNPSIKNTVSGLGNLKQYKKHQIDILIGFKGTFEKVINNANSAKVLFTLEGDNNTKIVMLLNEDLSRGYTNYQFTMPNGEIQILEFQPTLQLDKYSQFSPHNSWRRVSPSPVPIFDF